MAKGKHPRRPVHREATRRTSLPRRHSDQSRPEDQPFIQEVRRILRGDQPLGIAQFASALLLLPPSSDDGGPGLDVLIESFLEIRLAETTALLHGLAELFTDDLAAHRIRREVAGRTHPMPLQVTALRELTVSRAMAMPDPGGTGENLLLELSGPGMGAATFIVYVDHLRGTAVKDAFIAPEHLDPLVETFRELARQDGFPAVVVDVSLPDVRARVEDAVAVYDALTLSDAEGLPADSETWPQLRALLVRAVRDLPEGGVGYPDPDEDWDDEEWEEDDLAHDFLASPFGEDLVGDEEQDHEIAHLLARIKLATVGPGRPFTAEDITAIMRGILPVVLGDNTVDYERVPAVLRAFLRFTHEEVGSQAQAVDEVLKAVDMAEPAYLAARHDPAIIAARADIATLQARLEEELGTPYVVQVLRQEVGSDEAIAALTDTPLPDEPLDLASVPADIHERVQRIAQLSDQACDEFFDVEIRTACRRLLAMAAAGDPTIFRRRSKDETAAGAVVWLIGKANAVLGVWDGGPAVGEVLASLGVKGSVSQRAEPFLKALGLSPHEQYGEVYLGTPSLLTSATRSQLIHMRDGYAAGPEID